MRYHCAGRSGAVLLIALALLSTSCAAFWETESLLAPKMEKLDDELKELRVGDTVMITTKYWKQIKFKIVEVKADTLLGEHQKIAFDQIEKIKRVDSLGSTAKFYLGAYAIIAVTVSVIAAIFFSGI